MIELAKRSNLAEQITERLFQAILTGELKPGEQIIETKMARQLGVGQSTLREALQAMEHRGLVTKNRNTFVTELSIQDVEILFAVRLELEPLAASLACGRLTEAQLQELQHHLDTMETARRQHNYAMLLTSDLAFHQVVWEAPKVETLRRFLNLILPPLFAFFYMRHSDAFAGNPALAEQTFREEHQDHRRLMAALQSNDPANAKRTFQEVIPHFVGTILELEKEKEAASSSLKQAATAVDKI